MTVADDISALGLDPCLGAGEEVISAVGLDPRLLTEAFSAVGLDPCLFIGEASGIN